LPRADLFEEGLVRPVTGALADLLNVGDAVLDVRMAVGIEPLADDLLQQADGIDPFLPGFFDQEALKTGIKRERPLFLF